MSIRKYHEKRDFSSTKEPKGEKTNQTKKLRFVVQRHHASHLHYDFRLEIDGVLKSWAVPKGPSLNPKDKRLAMMVEDHPYDYKDFEGEIPKGNYGAGTVAVFDEGFYQSLTKLRKDDEAELREELEKGSLKFLLKGKVLKGEFALVRLKNAAQNAWLLIKHDDKYAQHSKFDIENLIPAAIKKAGKDFKKETVKAKDLPEKKSNDKDNYSPMLATLDQHIFDDKDWIFERKWDGYRIISQLEKQVKLITRNGKDYTDHYEVIADELAKIKEEVILDGEIVVLDKTGRENFQLLQHYEENKKAPIKYFIFDLLAFNGHDTTTLPLLQRKQLLEKLLKKYELKHIIYHTHVLEKGKSFFKKAEKEKWEGVIAKRKDDEYFVGKRSKSWLKFKFNNSQEALICGFTKPAGSRKYFGALVLGITDENGKIAYIGNCGTGFKSKDLKDIFELLKKLETKDKPFADKATQESNITWVKPVLVCEVNYTEWTKDLHLRHPVYKGLRLDKESSSVNLEKPEIVSFPKNNTDNKVENFGKKEVKLTHLNKIYWPQENISKGDLLEYYETMADFILPYLKNKPLSLNRHPNGIEKPGFFQKDVNTDQIPAWAKIANIHSESNDKNIDYLVCNDKATLLFMVNLGCIEINPWLSTFKKLENPDFMVIDLDPDKNPFNEVVEVALLVKKIYDDMGISSFVKTSGSSGMHIYVYVGALYDYDFVKDFARFIAQRVHELKPENTSLERSPKKRKGKIYIDFLQNRRGQTIAAPYSVRPKPGATVSFPLDWKELTEDLDMKEFHLLNVPELCLKRTDPWKDIFKRKQNLKKGLESLKRTMLMEDK